MMYEKNPDEKLHKTRIEAKRCDVMRRPNQLSHWSLAKQLTNVNS